MKLPTTKKERIQVFVLIAIGGVAVLYAGIQLGIRPLIEKKATYKARISEFKEKADKASRTARLMVKDLEDNRNALQTICKETDQYVLRATIGENYLLGVDEMMNRYARAAAVPIDAPKELAILDIPPNSARPGKNVLKAFTARVSFRGGYADMLRLLREIESSSPYVCVSAITLVPQTDPEVHVISLDIQWPVWAEKGMAEKLKTQAAENAEAEVKP